MKSKYEETPQGEWYSPKMRNFREQCCDCGMVHRVDYRIRKGQLETRVFRDERSTAQVRRHMTKKQKEVLIKLIINGDKGMVESVLTTWRRKLWKKEILASPALKKGDPAYVALLNSLPEETKEKYRNGSWDIREISTALPDVNGKMIPLEYPKTYNIRIVPRRLAKMKNEKIYFINKKTIEMQLTPFRQKTLSCLYKDRQLIYIPRTKVRFTPGTPTEKIHWHRRKKK